MMLDAIVVGAGPAGCSAASWLVQLGLRTALIEQATQPCATLEQLDFVQDWLLGAEGRTLRQIGRDIATHLARLTQLEQRLGRSLTVMRYLPDGSWDLLLDDGTALQTRCLVLATGVRPRRPVAYFSPEHPPGRVLDALDLTRQRHALPAGPVLLLGGGDNAVENALYLHERGHRVTLWTRAALRAQPGLMQRLAQCPGIEVRTATPLPRLLAVRADGVQLNSADHGIETVSAVAVLFGFEPQTGAYALVQNALRSAGFDETMASGVDTGQRLADMASVGVFIAGDASARMHPCVQTALADGVVAAKRVQDYLIHPLNCEQARAALQAEKMPSRHGQVLRLTGLRFEAPLGWLEREKHGPQPIKVDAELNMGLQPLLPDDDDLAHVLDYRKVRQIIIDECNLAHTHLIETLLGKLCLRLSGLPGVIGVRVQVTKLEIFDDCHVAMQAEVGVW
jgi:dihydroneopterin aldolase